MNEEMMKKLTIEAGGKIEVVVSKKKKFSFNVDKGSDIPEREVWLNVEELKEHGISDNTIATIRRFT